MQHSGARYDAAHASPYRPEEWHYMFSALEAEQAFLVGAIHGLFRRTHAHSRALHLRRGGGTADRGTFRITSSRGGRYIVNPGSVGQPRDGDARAACCVFDTDSGTITSAGVHMISRRRRRIYSTRAFRVSSARGSLAACEEGGDRSSNRNRKRGTGTGSGSARPTVEGVYSNEGRVAGAHRARRLRRGRAGARGRRGLRARRAHARRSRGPRRRSRLQPPEPAAHQGAGVRGSARSPSAAGTRSRFPSPTAPSTSSFTRGSSSISAIRTISSPRTRGC